MCVYVFFVVTNMHNYFCCVVDVVEKIMHAQKNLFQKM